MIATNELAAQAAEQAANFTLIFSFEEIIKCWHGDTFSQLILSCTNPIRRKEPTAPLEKCRGIFPVLEACSISDALITRIPSDEEPLCGNAVVYYYYYREAPSVASY